MSAILKALKKLEPGDNGMRPHIRYYRGSNRGWKKRVFWGITLSVGLLLAFGFIRHSDSMPALSLLIADVRKTLLSESSPPTPPAAPKPSTEPPVPVNRPAETKPEPKHPVPRPAEDTKSPPALPAEPKASIKMAETSRPEFRPTRPTPGTLPMENSSPKIRPTDISTDPSLQLQAVAWSREPGERIAVINGQILKEGDALAGVVLTRIEEDGVILRQGNTEKKLMFQLR